MKRYLNILLMATAMVFIACDKDDDGKNDDTDIPLYNAYSGSIFVQETDTSTFENPYIRVDCTLSDDKNTMTMTINKVKFSSRMPVELDITIPEIKVEKKDDSMAISGDGIVPEAMGGPFPKYTITNLEGSFSADKFTFSMMCGEYKTWFEGDVMYIN